ncbi:hypothetical protein [Bifidobacterium stellenboschense]|uniref:DUF2178 domain-containing protein n=1 Tax=Bifidobacterium stellenboschense TaxID=762211 RepID=A0A087DKW1_9BIFI|nr:hypothetical protein [Bifidobacterium stellenboschense]KFI96161.1 hypothetical protein BSTEL_1195 [Bifidobacterium stellenboschense]
MTFNRYVAFRMAVEVIGGVACAMQAVRDDDLSALIVTTIVALIWVAGETRVIRMLRRERPRTDELSDQHQLQAARFALLSFVAVACVAGFVGMLASLATGRSFVMPPMVLPALAMFALACADARYLWLERGEAPGDGDED